MADALSVRCPDCLAAPDVACSSRYLTEGEQHPDRHRLADLRALEHGTCALCGQWMVRGTVAGAPLDAWHPDHRHAAACPPLPDPLTDWNAYAGTVTAGLSAGHPGVEHFLAAPTEATAEETAGMTFPPLLPPHTGLMCPECVQGKCGNCTLITLDPVQDDFTPCTCTHGTTTTPGCPECGLPAEVPGEGRYCGVCQDYEGHCRNDHCMTCGNPT